MLLADLADFVTRHRPCGQLTGDATEPKANGYLLTVGCSCGVVFMRWVTPEEAERDLVGRDCGTAIRVNCRSRCAAPSRVLPRGRPPRSTRPLGEFRAPR